MRVLLPVFLLAILAAAATPAQAQGSTCSSLSYQLVAGQPNFLNATQPRQSVGLQFRTSSPCTSIPTAQPCVPGGSLVTYSLKAPLPTLITVTFSPNPAPTFSSGNFATSSSTMTAKLSPGAPEPSREGVVVEAVCGGHSATVPFTFYIGPLYDVNATVLRSGRNATGISFTVDLRATGSGLGFVTAQFTPSPTAVQGKAVEWAYPMSVDLAQPLDTLDGFRNRTSVDLLAKTQDRSLNFSVLIRPSLNAAQGTYGPDHQLALQVTAYKGRATPVPGGVLLVALVAAVALAAWRRP